MEFVFVVSRRALFPERDPQGFVPFDRVGLTFGGDGVLFGKDGGDLSLADFQAAVGKHGFFVERARAEVEPDWKQVIPYNVVVAGEEILLLRRT
jgi:hypothetical protein